MARSLAEAGWQVEIAAVSGDGRPDDRARRRGPGPPLPAERPVPPLGRPAAAAPAADEAAASPGTQRRQGAQGRLLADPRPGLVADAPARAPARRPLSRVRHPDPAGGARPGVGRPAARARAVWSSTTSSTRSSTRTTTRTCRRRSWRATGARRPAGSGGSRRSSRSTTRSPTTAIDCGPSASARRSCSTASRAGRRPTGGPT